MEGLRRAKTATKVLFGEDISNLTGDQIIDAFKTDVNRFKQIKRSEIIGEGLDKIASIANAAKSKCKLRLFMVNKISHTLFL